MENYKIFVRSGLLNYTNWRIDNKWNISYIWCRSSRTVQYLFYRSFNKTGISTSSEYLSSPVLDALLSSSSFYLFPITKPECVKVGVYPTCLKIGRTIQIYKSGDSTDPTNYRPISTLPYITKNFETCLYNRLVKFFDKFSLLSNFQFGFRKKNRLQFFRV